MFELSKVWGKNTFKGAKKELKYFKPIISTILEYDSNIK